MQSTNLQPAEVDTSGRNCFDLSILTGSIEIAKYIYDTNPTIAASKRCNLNGMNALHQILNRNDISENHQLAAVKFLAEYVHYDMKQVSTDGHPPFYMLAKQRVSINIVKYFSSKYKNIQFIKTTTGFTALLQW